MVNPKKVRALFIVLIAAIMVIVTGPGSVLAQQSTSWFEVETVNSGLGTPPREIDRSTPQGTMESFFKAIRSGNLDNAAHLLNLSDITAENQGRQGGLLAEKLGEVIERRLWIDWGELSDRPDALLEVGSSNDALAGQPRRSLRLEILDLNGRPVSIRLNRLKPSSGDAVWLFSRQTVSNVDALHARYGPGWFERRLPDNWRGQSVWSLQPWELLALPVAILIAAGFFVLFRWALGKLAMRSRWGKIQNAAMAARTPLALFLSVLGLDYISSNALAFSAPIAAILSPLLITAMAVAITLAVLKVIDSILDVVTRRYVGEIDDEQSAEERSFYTSIYALRRVVLLAAVAFGVGLVMMRLHLFQSLGISLLASAGVLTVILGIAGQTVLGNILASLQIAIAKPIRIGDSVHYEGDWAYVESIFYTFVRLRTWDDRRLIIPVQYFISNPFENWSMQDAKMTRTFTLVLDHSADVDVLRDAFLDFAKEDKDVMEQEETKVLVDDHDHNGKHVRFYATASDPTTAWSMHARLREAMLRWVEEHHRDWWPRDRVVDAGSSTSTARSKAAAAD